MSNSNRQLTIPFEVADGITLTVLQEHLVMLREEVRSHKQDGSYMHPEDYYHSIDRLIPSLEILIEYFGGDV